MVMCAHLEVCDTLMWEACRGSIDQDWEGGNVEWVVKEMKLDVCTGGWGDGRGENSNAPSFFFFFLV